MNEDDDMLDVLARVAILAGRLPRGRAQAVAVTAGTGACALCADTLAPGQAMYELAWEAPAAPALDACVLHSQCFLAWTNARQRLDGIAAPGVAIAAIPIINAGDAAPTP